MDDAQAAFDLRLRREAFAALARDFESWAARRGDDWRAWSWCLLIGCVNGARPPRIKPHRCYEFPGLAKAHGGDVVVKARSQMHDIFWADLPLHPIQDVMTHVIRELEERGFEVEIEARARTSEAKEEIGGKSVTVTESPPPLSEKSCVSFFRGREAQRGRDFSDLAGANRGSTPVCAVIETARSCRAGQRLAFVIRQEVAAVALQAPVVRVALRGRR